MVVAERGLSACDYIQFTLCILPRYLEDMYTKLKKSVFNAKIGDKGEEANRNKSSGEDK